MNKIHVNTEVNGDDVEFLCDPRETLLDALRDQLNLTGAKEGCGTGDCGACSITLDDRLVCSCLVLGVEAMVRIYTHYNKNLLNMLPCSVVSAPPVY